MPVYNEFLMFFLIIEMNNKSDDDSSSSAGDNYSGKHGKSVKKRKLKRRRLNPLSDNNSNFNPNLPSTSSGIQHVQIDKVSTRQITKYSAEEKTYTVNVKPQTESIASLSDYQDLVEHTLNSLLEKIKENVGDTDLVRVILIPQS